MQVLFYRWVHPLQPPLRIWLAGDFIRDLLSKTRDEVIQYVVELLPGVAKTYGLPPLPPDVARCIGGIVHQEIIRGALENRKEPSEWKIPLDPPEPMEGMDMNSPARLENEQ